MIHHAYCNRSACAYCNRSACACHQITSWRRAISHIPVIGPRISEWHA